MTGLIRQISINAFPQSQVLVWAIMPCKYPLSFSNVNIVFSRWLESEASTLADQMTFEIFVSWTFLISQ